MPYYTSQVKLINNKLIYDVPSGSKISRTKYKWFPENKGVADSLQAECCFFYLDVLPDTADRKSITEAQYNAFAKVIVTADKQTILADGNDSATVTAKFPEGGGIARFSIRKSGTREDERILVERIIPESGEVTLPSSYLKTTSAGLIRININSDKWSGKLGEVIVDAT